MKYYIVFLAGLLISGFAFANQEPTEDGIEQLKKRIELLELKQEESKTKIIELQRQSKNKGFLELSLGISMISPEDLQDLNDEKFRSLNDSEWGTFEYARMLEVMIGKKLQRDDDTFHELSIGYQHLNSEISARFTSGSSNIKAREKIVAHTLIARYNIMFKSNQIQNLFFGPGFSVGYSPMTKVILNLEDSNQGIEVNGESNSYLLEIFGKARYELASYMFLTSYFGYRAQKARDLKLSAADFISFRSDIDLDLSGLYAKIGLNFPF